MKKRARIITIVLAVIMILSVTACAKTETETTPTQQTKATQESEDETATEAPEEDAETVTIKVLMPGNIQSFYDGEDENNNEIIDYLENLTGYNLEYQVLPNEEGEQKLALIMSSGDLPDLIKWNGRDLFLDYVSNGYLTDLTDAVANNEAIQATRCVEEEPYTMSLVDGKAYAVCTPTNGGSAPDALWVFGEVADGLGIDVENPDMSLDGIKKMFADAKAAYPDKVVYSGAGATTLDYKLGDFRWLYAAYGVDTVWRESEDGGLEYCATTDDMYDCLAYIADMNANGYLDSEYSTLKTEVLQERIANRASSFYGVGWYDCLQESLFTNEDGETLFPILGQAVGDDGTTGQDKEAVINGYMMVPTGCEVVDDAISFVAALCADEVYDFMFYGTEGVDYEYDEDGVMQYFDENNYRIKTGMKFFVYYYIYEDFEQRGDRLAKTFAAIPGKVAMCDIYGYELKTKINPTYDMPSIEVYNDNISNIDDTCAEWFLKFATGAEALETGWAQFLAEFEENGGTEVEAAVSDWYKNK
jgi:putative aldouronate transport system substrate-binding protein